MRVFTSITMATFSFPVKEVGESRRNQLAFDGVRFLKLISDSLITEEQWADNYVCSNEYSYCIVTKGALRTQSSANSLLQS